MARQPKPWYWEERQSYYVTVRGTRHNLGADKTEADRLFHELMAARPNASPALPTGLTVADVFEKFLDWCQKHRSPRSYEWYKNHAQGFCKSLKPSARDTPAADLKPFHVVEWVDSHATWGANQRRGAVIAVQRPFNWAAKLGYLPTSPLRGVEKPKAERREQVVSPEDYGVIVASYREGDPFRDLLEFLWEAGCRPQEARHLEPRHFNREAMRFEIPPAEAKGKKRWRLIRLTDKARGIVERRLADGREKVFTNEDGNPWTVDAVNCRFGRLKKRLGVRYASYSIRHGFCQRMLESGADHLSVAELMGHANGQMVASVYSHMNKADAHLMDVLKKAAG